MSLLKNFNMQFHHTNCKTLHYLLDKTKIQNKFHHIFFQKVSGKWAENVCQRLETSITFADGTK